MLYQKVRFYSFLISTVFLSSTGLLFSQNQKFALSAYSNFAISKESVQKWHPQGIEVSNRNNTLGYFSPAVILFKENGDFHEFELARLSFNTKDAEIYIPDSMNRYLQLAGGARIDELIIALRYSYSHLIDLSNEESKFKVYFGFGASPYFQKERLTPKTSERFPVESSSIGVRFSAIPTLTYSITDHWFFNLNIPNTLGNAFVSSTKTENPVIPISDRTSNESDIKLFPNEFLLRFGLGLRI